MSEPVKTRRYHSPIRAKATARTRAAVVAAARDEVISHGYAAATVHRIAERADVNVDTLYRTVGRKPDLLRAVVESALSGVPDEVPAEQRDYVRRMREAPTAAEKLDIYASAITEIQQRLAPVFLALRDAARVDTESRELWEEIAERRAANMRDLAADLRATGELRVDLDDETVADIIWSMNATEYWVLLVERRGWQPERFRDWLSDAWRRLLLA